jgi:hypothetical protein
MRLLMLLGIYLMIEMITGTNQKFNAGYYRDTLGIFELNLKSNFTYTYQYKLGFKYCKSEGNWKKENNIVILNSSLEDLSKIPVTIKEEVKPKNNSVLFDIINPLEQDTVYKYQIVLNDTIFNYDKNGVYSLRKTGDSLQTIQLKFLCKDTAIIPFPLRNKLSSAIYQVKSSRTNYFSIKWDIDWDLFYYEAIRNDTLFISGKELTWPSHSNLILHKEKKHK